MHSLIIRLWSAWTPEHASHAVPHGRGNGYRPRALRVARQARLIPGREDAGGPCMIVCLLVPACSDGRRMRGLVRPFRLVSGALGNPGVRLLAAGSHGRGSQATAIRRW